MFQVLLNDVELNDCIAQIFSSNNTARFSSSALMNNSMRNFTLQLSNISADCSSFSDLQFPEVFLSSIHDQHLCRIYKTNHFHLIIVCDLVRATGYDLKLCISANDMSSETYLISYYEQCIPFPRLRSPLEVIWRTGNVLSY